MLQGSMGNEQATWSNGVLCPALFTVDE